MHEETSDMVSPWWYTGKSKKGQDARARVQEPGLGWQLRSITPIGRQQVWRAYNEDTRSKEGPRGGQRETLYQRSQQKNLIAQVYGTSLCIHDKDQTFWSQNVIRKVPKFLNSWQPWMKRSKNFIHKDTWNLITSNHWLLIGDRPIKQSISDGCVNLHKACLTTKSYAQTDSIWQWDLYIP